MKRVYTPALAVVFLSILAAIPFNLFAQCNCSVGHPATPVDYYVTMPVSNASSSSVTFPQFNPATGTLYCMSVQDTISAITTTKLQNTSPDTTIYSWLLSMSGNLTGPGLSVSQSTTKTYGPDTLAGLGIPGDNITHGPDTIFDSATGAKTISSPSSAYIGSGSFSFTFQMSGGAIPTQGGSNYTAQVITNYWGNFHLTYYWCPAAPLANDIQEFTATPDGSIILLQWQTANQQPNTQYEIQTSTDGKNFYSIGEAKGDASPTGTIAKYQHQYHPDPTNMGKLYFRIQETNAGGKVTYSAILIIDPKAPSQGQDDISYRTYPNPATGSLTFQFGSNQTGRFLVELISTAGQSVLQKAATLTGTSQIRLDLTAKPVKGLYFLRTTDLTHDRQYTSKVFIE
ncbi:MAG: T9SS type A sorting domain-containing protein [Bacteroidetes bacterium]|nr:T9SS type A sorting domain-containing protein [Bacteroidota bacterium]